MRSDFIKPLLKDYQVYGINFKNNNDNIFKNNSFDVSVSGTIQYNKGFSELGSKLSDSDLYMGEGRRINIIIPNLFNSHTQFTAIYKYRLYYYSDYFIPNRTLGGLDINLCASGGEFGVWNNDRWFRDGPSFGANGGCIHELAVECTPNRMKIWLDGIIKRIYNMPWVLNNVFAFGDYTHNLQMSVNDILITNALFLPNGNYTVDWVNSWYDKFSWYLYNHNKEVLAIPKKEE